MRFWRKFIEVSQATIFLIIVALCLLGYSLRYHSGLLGVFAVVEVLFTRPDTQWLFFIYLAIWCASLIGLTFSLKDFFLIGLLGITVFMYAFNYAPASVSSKSIVFLGGVTLGRGALFILKPLYRFCLLLLLVILLASASWCHLDMTNNSYHGPRWMGLWDNPNDYGLLVGVGIILASGVIFSKRVEGEKLKTGKILLWFATAMMVSGLFMSYSRGAWLAAAVGLLYLAWCYGRLKWLYVLPMVGIAAAIVLYLWGNTSNSMPWYVKRADLGRPSAQNRLTAWRAGLEMIRDHPLGLGWNRAGEMYGKRYNPPEGGPGALTTNDYLMMGTELGIPALLCFAIYVGLSLRTRSGASCQVSGGGGGQGASVAAKMEDPSSQIELDWLKVTCRAGAIVLLVGFWFDGGLFKLATGSVFWVLLELGKGDVPPDSTNTAHRNWFVNDAWKRIPESHSD